MEKRKLGEAPPIEENVLRSTKNLMASYFGLHGILLTLQSNEHNN